MHHLTASVETALFCHQEQNYKMKIFLFHDPSSTGQVSAEVIRHIRRSRFQFQTRTNFSFSFIWSFLFEKIVWLFLLLRAAKGIDGILFFFRECFYLEGFLRSDLTALLKFCACLCTLLYFLSISVAANVHLSGDLTAGCIQYLTHTDFWLCAVDVH